MKSPVETEAMRKLIDEAYASFATCYKEIVRLDKLAESTKELKGAELEQAVKDQLFAQPVWVAKFQFHRDFLLGVAAANGLWYAMTMQDKAKNGG